MKKKVIGLISVMLIIFCFTSLQVFASAGEVEQLFKQNMDDLKNYARGELKERFKGETSAMLGGYLNQAESMIRKYIIYFMLGTFAFNGFIITLAEYLQFRRQKQINLLHDEKLTNIISQLEEIKNNGRR